MATPDQGFSKARRITRPVDFERVYRRRCSASDDVLLIFAAQNDLPHCRLGLSVSRKVGNAVVRARWKRRLREAFRLRRPELPAGFDLVVIPRASDEPDMPRLMGSLVKVAGRAVKRAARGN